MSYVFQPAPCPSLPVIGRAERFPVRRIYCVGRNYADHAREMGADPQKEPPFFFAKPADALVAGGEARYPSLTRDYHHEVELVAALHAGGRDIPAEQALACVFGYAVGLDMTRRDIQAGLRAKGWPWDMAKGADQSAPVGAIRAAAEIGHPASAAIRLRINGALKQEGNLAQMILPVAEVIAELSRYVELAPGDLIFTGTPAGVGPVQRGDLLEGEVEGVGALAVRFV